MNTSGTDPARATKGQTRLDRQREYLAMCDMRNPQTPYFTPDEYQGRMLELMNFAGLHGE
jgi:hypothetical protein